MHARCGRGGVTPLGHRVDLDACLPAMLRRVQVGVAEHRSMFFSTRIFPSVSGFSMANSRRYQKVDYFFQ
jgi:hypothetical protein